MNDIRSALQLIAADPEARGVLVEVLETEGSSPRVRGARMLLGPDGAFSGTVGGGPVEYLAQREARGVLDSGEACRRAYSLGGGNGQATGAICGGSALVGFRVIGQGEAAALLAAWPRPPRVLLYGAGHVARALADALHLLDFAVAVTDDRAELLTPERFPHAERRLLTVEETVVDAGAEDIVAIMTRGHVHDYAVLLPAMRSPAGYVGCIGSRKKAAAFRQRLLEDGISQRDIDARLHSPIGLAIGAQTPEEIAVSVTAEIIQYLHS